jgi:hypothetical protein
MSLESRRPQSGTWFLRDHPIGPAVRVVLFALAALLLFLAHAAISPDR